MIFGSCTVLLGEKNEQAINDSDKRGINFFFFFEGFELTIDHPHTHVVKCTQLVRGK